MASGENLVGVAVNIVTLTGLESRSSRHAGDKVLGMHVRGVKIRLGLLTLG